MATKCSAKRNNWNEKVYSGKAQVPEGCTSLQYLSKCTVGADPRVFSQREASSPPAEEGASSKGETAHQQRAEPGETKTHSLS